MKKSFILVFLCVILTASYAGSKTLEVTGHVVIGYRVVDLIFSDPLSVGSGDHFANYLVYETDDPEKTIEIWGVRFGEDSSTVRIVLYDPMDAGASYTVGIYNVVAQSDTVLPLSGTYSFVATDVTGPAVISSGTLSSRELEIVFTEDMVDASAELPENYLLCVAGDPGATVPIYYAMMRGVYDRVVLELEEDLVAGTSYSIEAIGLTDIAGNDIGQAGMLTFDYDGENEKPRIGLYADFEHTITATDGDGLYSFDMWVWVKPDEGGAQAAIFGIDYPFGVSHELPQYNPELSGPIFDLDNGGIANFGSCRTEWTWVCKQNVIVNVDVPGIISIFPFDMADRQVAYIKCGSDFAIGNMEVTSNIEINSPDSRPVITDAYFSGSSTINISFDVPLDQASASTESNYEIFEAVSPGNTVPVDKALLLNSGTMVVLKAGTDLTEGLDYTVRINGVERIGGTAIRPDSEVDFTAIDIVPPTVISSTMTGQQLVDVTFSEPVEKSSAISLNNYLFVQEGRTVSDIVHVATLLDDGMTVRLETEEPLDHGVRYILKISNVEDLRGNIIANKSESDFFAIDVFPPTLKRIWSYPGNIIKLVFDEVVDDMTAGLADNYKIGIDFIPINSVSVDGKEVTIELMRTPDIKVDRDVAYTRHIEDEEGNYNEDWVKYEYEFHYDDEESHPGLGLYVDQMRTSGRVDAGPMDFFTFYVYARPGTDGVAGIEYALRDISQEDFSYYLVGLENDEGYTVSIGEPYSGIGIVIGDCHYDWFWMTRYDAVLINGKGFIEIVPTDYWILPSILTCEGFDSHYAAAEILNRIAVNTNYETVVSTALQSSSTRYDGDSVELLWQLSSIDEGVTFRITRTSSEGDHVELDPVLVESNGLSFRLVDSSIGKDMEYTYRVEYSLGGQSKLLFESEKVKTQAMTFTLHQNTPNPFNPTTTIRYYVPAVCDVRLEIFDVTGKRITVLEDKVAEKGEHQIDWNGLDDCGNRVSSGIYFYRLRAGKELVSRKMVLLR